MSRGYRVAWVTVQTTVTASDSLSMGLSLLGILPPEEMASLLRDELLRDGWSRTRKGTLVKHTDGVVATLDSTATAVTVTTETTADIAGVGISADVAQEAAKRSAKTAQVRLTQAAKATLESAEPDLRVHLGEAVQRVYVEALRRKAASMGKVESVLESRGADGAYEVTIKVKT